MGQVEEKHAFLVGGTHSGCGKTTISLGLMAAFKKRGMRVQPFKVGPDFIDPGYHSQVTGLHSRNLDGWMLGREYSGALFLRLLEHADLSIVEGVMGLFDGYDGIGESGSSAEMAKWLGLPVVLVVDARSMARSAAALVYGFHRFDPGLSFAGVIFNRTGGPGHLEYLREAMSANVPEIPVLGGIPREDLIHIPERHLGLVTADEITVDPAWEKKLVDLLEQYVDLDSLLKHTSRSPERAAQCEAGPISHMDSPVPIAVARDAAFCFYYQDNLDMLRQAGARLCFFSPLGGESIPGDAAGLYLGGGYPELYAGNLSSREDFLASIRRAVSQGLPIYAECGGLMVLSRFIETLDSRRYPMAGILPFGTRMLPRRKALGYTEVVLTRDCHLGKRNLVLRGHEFHYSEIMEEESNAGLALAYQIRGKKTGSGRAEGYLVGSVLASYVHLHWGSAPQAPVSFVQRCRDYRTGVK
jgi:cobyrinic acid a,c-diamide synthase